MNMADIENFDNIVGEERETLVKARINHSVFKKKLLKRYGKCCCLSKTSIVTESAGIYSQSGSRWGCTDAMWFQKIILAEFTGKKHSKGKLPDDPPDNSSDFTVPLNYKRSP